ncbi:FHA domain-containing protein, partial [Mycobacterium talmoniae]|uniref:FHA domain-containing protein n=1 Tax=Mycobacterium talmoniae TaxID=1858794 RepID=UPI001058FFB6
MPSEASAAQLTVWVGSAKYAFSPGPDVTVGLDPRCDIRLDGPDTAISPIHLVLRCDDGQWVAIDSSRDGIYRDGVRVPTVTVADGQAITLGDPVHGPRLVFRVSAPAQAPLPPSELPTGPI